MLVRAAGAVAGSLRRAQPGERGTDLAAAKATFEGLIGLVLEAIAGRDIDFGGDAMSLIARYGTVQLLLRLGRLPVQELGKRLGILILAVQLLIHRGDDRLAMPLPQAPGLLDLVFSVQNRRTARRLLERLAPRVGLDGLHLDLFGMWRHGALPISVRRFRAVDVSARDATTFVLLCTFLVLCDLARLGRPVDVLARVAIGDLLRRWPTASEDFRRALSEALLLATRDHAAYPRDELRQVVETGLQKMDADRAGGLLLGFHQLGARLDESFTLRDFLGRLIYLADQFAGLETDVEHMRRLDRAARRQGRSRRFRVVELDRPHRGGGLWELADETHDPQRSVPVMLDLERAMAELSPGERQTFLRKLVGFSPQEIARRIGSTPQAVRVMQCKARIKLRQLMGERRRAS